MRSAAEGHSHWKEVFSQVMVANDQTRYAEKKKTKIEVEPTMSSSDKFVIVGGVLEIGER